MFDLSTVEPLPSLDYGQKKKFETLEQQLHDAKFALDALETLRDVDLTNKSGQMPMMNRAETLIKEKTYLRVIFDPAHAQISYPSYVYLGKAFSQDESGRLVKNDDELTKLYRDKHEKVKKLTDFVLNFNLHMAKKKEIERQLAEYNKELPEVLRIRLQFGTEA